MLPDVNAELDAVCNLLQNLSLSGSSQNLPSSLTTLQRDLSPNPAPPPDDLEHRTDSVPPSDSDDALPKHPSAIPHLHPTSTRSSTTDVTRQDPLPTSSKEIIPQAPPSSITTHLSPPPASPPDELENRGDSVPPNDSDDALPKPPSAIPLLHPTSTRSSTTDQTRLGQDPQPT